MTAQRPFAVFDIDGTLIRWQLFHAIVTQLADEQKLSHAAVDAIERTRETWRTRSHDESFGGYEQAIVDGYHSAIKDLSVSDFMTAVDLVFDAHKDQVYTYTRDLIKDLQAKGYLIFAISGSQQEIVEKLGQHYGFDDVIGATYTIADGRFTGDRVSPVDNGKGVLVQKLVDRWDASWRGSVAIGDSMSDAEMLALVEQPIAFNPNRQLFDEAQRNGWDLVIERKNVIYRLQQKDDIFTLLPSDNVK